MSSLSFPSGDPRRPGLSPAVRSTSAIPRLETTSHPAALDDWHALPPSYHETHVNSSMANMQTARRNTRRRALRSDERALSVGNDGRIPWIPRPPTREVVVSVVETLPVAPLFTTSSTVPTFGSAFFTVSSLADITGYSNLFEQYRITRIEVLIEPQVSETTNTSADPGEYISVVDIDDANTPTSYPDLGSYTTAVQTRGTQQHYHCWTPTVAVAVYSGAFTSFAATTSMWLDMGSPNIQHYGLKAGAPVVPAGGIQSYLYQARLHVSFRGRH